MTLSIWTEMNLPKVNGGREDRSGQRSGAERSNTGHHLSDSAPLISAALSQKLRLVRLLVEGGAPVNGRNARGETALLAACKALRTAPAAPDTLKLITYLLQNKADPNAQDRAGRTALMYICMERAGADVAAALLAAGADPCLEDFSGASALVYAINAQQQPTVQVLLDTCRARGRDILIIATERGANGSSATRRYLNVPPSPTPDSSLASCMTPSDIVLKAESPRGSKKENIFDFRAADKESGTGNPFSQGNLPLLWSPPAGRSRTQSEPWLAIHNLARLNRSYEDGVRERRMTEQDTRADYGESTEWCGDDTAQVRAGVGGESIPLTQRLIQKCLTPARSVMKAKLRPQLRRNTLPSVTVIPSPLHLPPLESTRCSLSGSVAFLPQPPHSPPCRAPLPLAPPTSSAAAHSHSRRSRRSTRRHSVQLEQISGQF